MKGEIRKKYQEFINHIDFPTIIYVYENNRVLAVNSYAKSLLGDISEDIRDIFDGRKLKFPKDLIKGGSKLLLNVGIINTEKENINIDIDINIFKVDNVHFVLMLFENTFKNSFIGHLSVQTPRVAWQYANDSNIGMNTGLKNDIISMGFSELKDNQLSFLDDEIATKIYEIGNRIIDNGESQFNSIQMITTSNKNSHFIKVHRMPIINNAGENIGVISVHNKILNKEKHKALFDSAIKSNNLVNEIIDKGDTVFISWVSDEKGTVQYISPNITRYGYTVEDFASGNLTFRDIIFKDDDSIIQCKFKIKSNDDESEVNTSVYEYRIIKLSGEIVWVHEECTPVSLGNSIVYNFSSLQDITSRKMIETELNERKREYQLRHEHIVKTDDVDLHMFSLEELFNFDDIKGVQKLLSEVMYLISFITDNKGNILNEPISSIPVNEELKKLISARKSIKMYKETGTKSYRTKEPCIDSFYCDSIKMTAIPFYIADVHLGNLVVIAIVGNTEISLSDRNNKRYSEYLKMFSMAQNKSFKEYKGIVNFLWEHVQTLCRAEYHNIELIKEKDNLQKTADINKALISAWRKQSDVPVQSKIYDNESKKFISAKIENVTWIDGSEALLVTMNDVDNVVEDNKNESAYDDLLTGLPNRLKFELDAKVSIMRTIEKNKNGAVIMFDIDDFKTINYRLGHEYGEKFLKEIARIIKEDPDIKDCTYRCRGVEFLILLEYDNESEIERISDKIIDYFKKPWSIEGKEFYCSLSMGITVFPRDGINPKELLKNADLAMYEAKKQNDSIKVYYKTKKFD